MGSTPIKPSGGGKGKKGNGRYRDSRVTGEALELFVSTLALLGVTVVASVILYRLIRDARTELDSSKESIRNITFGFTRQVNRLQQEVANTEGTAATAKITAAEALKQSVEAKEATLQGLEAVKGLNNRVQEAESAVESMRKEVQKLAAAPRARVQAVQPEVSAAIPVQKTSILSQLTYTELDVLRKIAGLSESTAPEIRDQIGLTREHTARMLKKLYDAGFVDRSTAAMPYRYAVRKEIRDLILQQEPGQLAAEK